MGLSANLFFDLSDVETLSSRISLTTEQISEAKEKKDKLLDLLKSELSSSLEIPVKHWLQGSYKNHTLIRPVRKGGEFDIDVGIYILCNAEEEGFAALDAKNLNRKVLEWFASNRPEAKLEDTKNSCERLSYPASFHIDIPLYYYDSETGVCKLATQDDEWIDSDPKALQSWFDKNVSSLSTDSLAQLRRVIKYLKTWTALKEKEDAVKISSIALTVLVARYFVESDDDDDAFIKTSIKIMNYIAENEVLENPVHGGDLFGFNSGDYQKIRKKALALRKSCQFIEESADSLQQYVLWNATFEHMFPPFTKRKEDVSKSTNLPATTVPPKIRVRHLDKTKNIRCKGVINEIKVYRDEGLYFSIENSNDYSETAEVHWIVRNQDNEAKRFNDLGHTSVLTKNDECYEGCCYSGTHYMECLIIDNKNIEGITAVKVNITGFSRPPRNSTRKKHFKRK